MGITQHTTERNYDKLFLLLEKSFPNFINMQSIQKKVNIEKDELEQLHGEGYLEDYYKHQLEKSVLIEGKEATNKARHTYRLSPHGFEFLNSIYARKLNKRIELLRWALIILGGGQILLAFIMILKP